MLLSLQILDKEEEVELKKPRAEIGRNVLAMKEVESRK